MEEEEFVMSNGKAEIVRGEEKYLGRARSGRWFVVGAVVTIIVLWAALFLIFRDWRARHRELAAFGAREVAALVDPLADLVPPSVDPKQWRKAVVATHGMLEVATGSGTIDRAGLEQLRDKLRTRFAKVTPDSVAGELSTLWDEMQKQVGPILSGNSSRPPFCPARPKLLGGRGDEDL
jgi:hypothetical protein